MDDRLKAAVMTDWADSLEDWGVEQVKWGLREWRKDNPNKRPNPDHITAILKRKRGEVEMAKVKAQIVANHKPDPEPERLDAEARAKLAAELGLPTLTPKRFGGDGAED